MVCLGKSSILRALAKPIFTSVQTGVPDKWTSDSKHFILENFDTICNSPSQIYGSVLTLCPSSSWLHKCYTPRVKAVVKPAEWGACTRTISWNREYTPSLAYKNNTIATGRLGTNITIFDTATGSQTAVLSGHKGYVQSLAFSSDGTLLASGGKDNTIKLWDVQTGGVVKTFNGHTDIIRSVSISVDNTTIASGSDDRTICLWNIGTEECHVIKGHNDRVTTVSFSPTNSQLLLSASRDGTVQKWNTDGHQIGSPVAGSHVTFSPDGTQFVSCKGTAVTIQSTDSGATIAVFNLVHAKPYYCCFSPDGRFIACAAHYTIYIWDITGPNPHLIKTLVGHTEEITSIVFTSSLTLVSASEDCTVKFWEIGASLANPVTPHTESISLTSAPIRAVSLQAKEGLAFSVDSAGVMKTWSISTGLCKESFETQAKDIHMGDIQLIGGRFTIVGCKEDLLRNWKIHIWDAEKGELQTMDGTGNQAEGIKMSGDGSSVFCVDGFNIQAWSIQTGKSAGKRSLGVKYPCTLDPLWIDGSKVLVRCRQSSTLGWDFGIPGSTPTKISTTSSDRPHLDFISGTSYSGIGLVGIEDRLTGKVVFQLYGPFARPSATQWDGHYLIAGYESGEVLILDLSHMLS